MASDDRFSEIINCADCGRLCRTNGEEWEFEYAPNVDDMEGANCGILAKLAGRKWANIESAKFALQKWYGEKAGVRKQEKEASATKKLAKGGNYSMCNFKMLTVSRTDCILHLHNSCGICFVGLFDSVQPRENPRTNPSP